jgi:hypothetical protein
MCLAVVTLAGLIPCLVKLRHPGAPMEDAAMLLRYSEHLAQGHGITWNVGEHPVEGATDFLYMVAIAAVAFVARIGVIQASRTILVVSIVLLPPVIFLATRCWRGANLWLRLAVSLFMAALPSVLFLSTCFGAPFMALAVALAWGMANRLMFVERGLKWVFGFAGVSLFCGLIRPEGVILALLMLISVIYVRRREATQVVLASLSVFLSLGLIYFLWRWHYFGFILPNAFYVKGGGHIYWDGFRLSCVNMVKLTWPVLLMGCLAVRSKAATQRLVAMLIPLAGFTAIWIFLSAANNHQMRFQYPLVPLALISAPGLVNGLANDLHLPAFSSLSRSSRTAIITLLCMSFLVATTAVYRSFSPPDMPSSGTTLPVFLSKYASRGYTMATTEAGQFPFYSKWNAIDTLGLNDAYIAHHGLSEAYLDRYKPELLLYHTHQVVAGPSGGASDAVILASDELGQAGRIMQSYALHHSYTLAAAYGDSVCNLHFFWIKNDSQDSEQLIKLIRDTPYYFLDSGRLSTDYREHIPAWDCFAGSR